jgi:hypothetical protein
LAYVRIDVAIPSPAHQIVAWESRSSRMKTVSTSPWSSDQLAHRCTTESQTGS